jgi:deoxyribodipyrimidine photo-lyase
MRADLTRFDPTDAAWQERLAKVDPAAYGRTRNHLTGRVSGLSPYLTHGFLPLREAARQVHARQRLDWNSRWVAELAWRAFFLDVQARRGEAILQDMRPSVLRGVRYRTGVPDDVRQARTGIPVIDQAVRTLYATGYLHNHARMWLASYLVHLRKVHWRSGADWMWSHLLDGELASNHLSWQWVAGTFSAKPYLFNADNVARFAPPGWQSPGSVIDTDYGTLEACARGQLDLPHEPLPAEAGVTEPQQLPEPPGGWPSPAVLPNEVRVVELVHPWSLQAPAAGARSPARLRVGWLLPAAHGTWPWSALRWNFVLTRLHQVCDHVATLDAPTLRGWQTRGITLVAAACRMPAYADVLSQLRIEPIVERPLFPDAGRESASFTRYYQSLQSLAPDFSRLIE